MYVNFTKKIKLSNFSVKNIKIRNTRFVLTSERYIFQQPLIITQSTIPHIFYYSVLNASTGSFFAAILAGIILAISVSTKLRAINPIDD